MKIDDTKCAPGKTFTEGSCINKNILIEIANNFNKHDNVNINTSNNKLGIIQELNNNFKKKYKCTDQICWLSQKFVKTMNNNELNKYTFRPIGPSKKYDWLSTNNINDVIEQYEKNYNDFLFLGTVPYDFMDLSILEFDKLDFEEMCKDNIHKLGLVINLDTHNQPGSHWVALYANLKDSQVYFFDSFAKKPGKRIKKFINKIIRYLYFKTYKKKININNIVKNLKNNEKNNYIENLNNFDIRYNKIQHQFKNSECGIYSINFILRLLKGEDFDYITKNVTSDNEINKCRKIYFSN